MSVAAKHALRGVWTALVTPFNATGGVDIGAYRALLQDQRLASVAGVVPCGTTGESPTLTLEEKKELILLAIQEMDGSDCGVIAGTGTNDTAETIELSQWASQKDVDGVLIVTPYYNKPSQAGMEAHFRAVADVITCPIVLYNVPGRTGVSLTAETITRLAAHPRIQALKEATGNVALTSEILDHLTHAGLRQKFALLSGDDATFLPLLSVGAQGVISVASNLFPRGMVALQTAYERGEVAAARELHERFYPLFRDLFLDSNPVPIKAALKHAGWCRDDVRLPLIPLATDSCEKLLLSMQRCGIRTGRAAQ